MARSFGFKLLILLALLAGLIPGHAVGVLAHAGHDHSDEPTVSLPEVIAKVNDTDIRKEAIWPKLKKSVRHYKNRGIPLTPEQQKIAARKLLEEAINKNLMAQKARAVGITVSDAQVNTRLSTVKAGFKSDSEFKRYLADQGLTLDSFKNQLRTELAAEALVQRDIVPHIQITEDEMKAYFEKHKEQLLTQEQRRASVILIKADPRQGPEGEKKALETLEKIKAKLAEGVDFGDLARQYSQDTLAKRGGDLGYFTKDRMFPPFSKHAFSMNVGEVSDVFRTRHGYQILKLTDIKPGSSGTYEGEKEKIRAILMDREIKKRTLPYIEALRKEASIKVYF